MNAPNATGLTLTLTLPGAQRFLLGPWLTTNPTGARGLLYEPQFATLDSGLLEHLRAEVRSMRARYGGAPSILISPVLARGDGGPARPESDGPGISWWERAWLIIDRAQTEGRHADAFAAIRTAYSNSPILDIVGIFLLASADLDEARERARALAALPPTTWQEGMNDRGPWVQWLAGAAPLPNVSASTSEDGAAVVKALAGDWAACHDLTPTKHRHVHLQPIAVDDEHVMRWRLLRQIWRHERRLGPEVDVLRKSLNTLFSHWGRTKDDVWHNGVGVGSRLPLLALVARIARVDHDPLPLLYEQRQVNPHLTQPPARTFTLPKDVDDAYAAYDAMLSAAIAHGGVFTRRPFARMDEDLVLVSASGAGASEAGRVLRFRVNPKESSTPQTFTLPLVDGETVADLKARVSPQVGPHQCYFVLEAGGRPLKLVEPVASLLSAVGADFDVSWSSCSHGAPMHPVTGESACFWDGSRPQDVEY